MYRRSILEKLLARMGENRKFMQILIGPRQTGKTTLARQMLKDAGESGYYASADDSSAPDKSWIETQWDTARLKMKMEKRKDYILVLDEIQKISDWSGRIKGLWDADTAAGLGMKVVLLGSSALLLQKGLSESLAGRFEIIRVPHWSYTEMKVAFGFTLDQYLYFGGYPGPAGMAGDEERWKAYVRDSLIETALSKDVLMLQKLDKPFLLRRLFELGCAYSCMILSYNKMLGQLQDAGNTVTLAHYLSLLDRANLLTGLQMFAGDQARRRGSSPKFLVYNTALISAMSANGFLETVAHPSSLGRLTESAAGAHILNGAAESGISVNYWRDRDNEADFILSRGRKILAVEIKSGAKKERAPGLEKFCSLYKKAKRLMVGQGGMPLEEFLSVPPAEMMEG